MGSMKNISPADSSSLYTRKAETTTIRQVKRVILPCRKNQIESRIAATAVTRRTICSNTL